MITPRFLESGDRIALVSPSYKVPDDSVEKTADLLWEWGFQPVTGPGADRLWRGCYSGTAEERAAELRWALEDPTIDAILCCRGGYGALHLLPLLPPGIFAANPKWLVGFSDITTLHSLSVCDGVMSVHGPMCSTIGGDPASATMLRELLCGSLPSYGIPASPLNKPGTAEGMLVGGNIATFAPLAGTGRDFLEKDRLILFIEEVEESYHAIDRLFNTLRLRGVLDRTRGIVLGQFTDCSADIKWDSAEEMIASYAGDIPLCCGFPAGHDKKNLPFIEGAQVRLSVGPAGSTLEYI